MELKDALALIDRDARNQIAGSYEPTKGADDNFVTDAEKIVIGNTSSTNTGDQVISDATISITDITTNNVSSTKHGFAPKGDGTTTKFLNANGTYSTPDSGGIHEYAIVKDVKASGTNGGTFTAGAWRTRDLNTIETNISGCSLSTNQITLPAGTYLVSVSAPAYDVNLHEMKLMNITDTLNYYAPAMMTNSTYNGMNVAQLKKALVVITSPKVFEVRHYCSSTSLGIGFGTNSSVAAGMDSVFTQVYIEKIG